MVSCHICTQRYMLMARTHEQIHAHACCAHTKTNCPAPNITAHHPFKADFRIWYKEFSSLQAMAASLT